MTKAGVSLIGHGLARRTTQLSAVNVSLATRHYPRRLRPGYPPVAEDVLLVGRQLRHPPAIGKLKYRVVTEAAAPPRLMGYVPLNHSLGKVFLAIRPNESHHAPEASGAPFIGHALETL